MLEVVEGNIHQCLCVLFDEHQAHYRVMVYDAVGQYEVVSAIRDTVLGQGVKALVCKVKGSGVNQHVLAVLAADQQADLVSLARRIGRSKTSLVSLTEMDVLTVCVFGAIPPFSFHPALRLVVDPLLFERLPQIAFNTGRLDRSIILDTEDYLHIVRSEIAIFRRFS